MAKTNKTLIVVVLYVLIPRIIPIATAKIKQIKKAIHVILLSFIVSLLITVFRGVILLQSTGLFSLPSLFIFPSIIFRILTH